MEPVEPVVDEGAPVYEGTPVYEGASVYEGAGMNNCLSS
jgi:hypothetical protein